MIMCQLTLYMLISRCSFFFFFFFSSRRRHTRSLRDWSSDVCSSDLMQDMPSFHGNDGWVLPIPATFVVGRDGIVKTRFIDPDFRKRMEIDDLLAALHRASEEH